MRRPPLYLYAANRVAWRCNATLYVPNSGRQVVSPTLVAQVARSSFRPCSRIFHCLQRFRLQWRAALVATVSSAAWVLVPYDPEGVPPPVVPLLRVQDVEVAVAIHVHQLVEVKLDAVPARDVAPRLTEVRAPEDAAGVATRVLERHHKVQRSLAVDVPHGNSFRPSAAGPAAAWMVDPTVSPLIVNIFRRAQHVDALVLGGHHQLTRAVTVYIYIAGHEHGVDVLFDVVVSPPRSPVASRVLQPAHPGHAPAAVRHHQVLVPIPVHVLRKHAHQPAHRRDFVTFPPARTATPVGCLRRLKPPYPAVLAANHQVHVAVPIHVQRQAVHPLLPHAVRPVQQLHVLPFRRVLVVATPCRRPVHIDGARVALAGADHVHRAVPIKIHKHGILHVSRPPDVPRRVVGRDVHRHSARLLPADHEVRPFVPVHVCGAGTVCACPAVVNCAPAPGLVADGVGAARPGAIGPRIRLIGAVKRGIPL
mmetsp:Transcript_28199/g.73119  ORF Transcript_28199/g.73119 Transcript_28199/m.73119 type:complete len:478 (+) Transcript_28199:176-1609(+)